MNYLLAVILFFASILNGDPTSKTADWKFKSDGKIVGSAAISDGHIYFGTTTGSLYALDLQTGKKLWQFKASGRWASKPLVDSGYLYQLNGNGKFYAIDKSNGKIYWTFSTGGEHRMKRKSGSKSYDDIWDYYLSGSDTNDDTIFFGSSDSHVYALDSGTGTLKWKYATNGEVHATPLIHDNTVYAGSMDGRMYALNISDGTPQWIFDTVGARYFPNGAVQRAPIIVDNALIFGSRDYNLYALDAETGKGLWNYKDPGGWIVATPAENNGKVFVGTSDSHLFYNFDAGSGKLNWEKSLNMRVYGSAVFDDQLVYFGCFNGYLYGLNPKDGSVAWTFQTDGSKENYHTVYNENDEFRDDFHIYGSTLKKTIASEEQLQSMGSIMSTPVISDGKIYFGSTDSTFYAVELSEE